MTSDKRVQLYSIFTMGKHKTGIFFFFKVGHYVQAGTKYSSAREGFNTHFSNIFNSGKIDTEQMGSRVAPSHLDP